MSSDNVLPDNVLPDNFTIDVHTHPIPEFYKAALIEAGATVEVEQLVIDGFATPHWALDSYMENRNRHGFDFSLLSITAPGVSFLKTSSAAAKLAHRLNDQMAAWIKMHPTRLGALGVLPIPDIASSLDEIKVNVPKPGTLDSAQLAYHLSSSTVSMTSNSRELGCTRTIMAYTSEILRWILSWLS